MGRPKLSITSAELSAEIARVQQQSEQHLRQLEERRRLAEARENERRGQLILKYLNAPRGSDLRSVLLQFVEVNERSLFRLTDEEADAHSGEL